MKRRRRAATLAEVRSMQVRGVTWALSRPPECLILDDLEDEKGELELLNSPCKRCDRGSLVRVPEEALLVNGSLKIVCMWCDWARMNVVCLGWFTSQVRKRRKLMIRMTKNDLTP